LCSSAGGIIGGVGHTIPTLTVARVLIGIGTSAGYPATMMIIRRRAIWAGLDQPPGRVLGGLTIAGTITVAIGPPIGGMLVDLLGWRSTFLVNIPITVIALLLTMVSGSRRELLDRFAQGRHCQWLDHSGPQTSVGVLDLTRPDAAVAPGRLADHGKRLVMQCIVTPPTRQPVDCATRHRGNSPAVARDNEHRISLGSGHPQGDDRVRRPLGFQRLVVPGQADKVVEHVHHYSVG
jgi:hypothetical protein